MQVFDQRAVAAILCAAVMLAGTAGCSVDLPPPRVPDLPAQSVSFTEVKPIAAWVNDESQNGGYEVGDEIGFPAFAIVIHNPTTSPVMIRGVDFVIDSAKAIRAPLAPLALFADVDHQQHLPAWIETAAAGERVRIPIAFSLEQGHAQHFTVWFQSPVPPADAVLVEGHLALDDNLATSRPFKVVLPGNSTM